MLRRTGALCALLCASNAGAQDYPRDRAAQRMIDRALDEHYLQTDFDEAERILVGTVNACEDKCSPRTLARAWMYTGIVRGTGKNDAPGALEAFRNALASDREIELDVDLAQESTREAFASAQRELPAASDPAPPKATSVTTAPDDHPICPPDLPGCIAEGDVCRSSSECQSGLVCRRDDDDGKRRCKSERSEPIAPPPATKRHEHWIGAALALDFALAPREVGVCSGVGRYRCYAGSAPFTTTNPDNAGVGIGSGMARGGSRLLLVYQYAFDSRLALAARAGLALGGAPEGFLPFHGELRFLGALAEGPLRPLLFGGAGVAQVDAPVSVELEGDDGELYTVDAYAAFGRFFLAAGAGHELELSAAVRLEAGMPAVLLLPDSGLVLMPEVSLTLGL